MRHALGRSVDVMVVVGVALVAGAVLPVAPAETLLALVVVAGLAWIQPRRPGVALGVAFALLVGVASGRAAWAVAAHERARAAAALALPAPVRCAGQARVVESPVGIHGALRWTGFLTGLECDGEVTAWSGRATLYGGPPDLARGDELEVVAQLAPPERMWNSATGDPRPGEARRAVLRTGGLIDARVLRRRRGVRAWIDRARAHVRRRIDDTFAGDTGPMARALVLGESDLAPEDDLAFRTSGLAHLLAVSGMHLVLVVAGLTQALEALLVRVARLAGRMDVGRVAAAIGICVAWAYADFAGAGGSTLRAAWMMTAAYAARAVGRRSTGPRAFGLSLVAMAVHDPLVVFDVSFLLSAGATAGLLAFARPLGARFTAVLGVADGSSVSRVGMAKRLAGWLRSLATAAATTLAATVPCAPILARFAPTFPLGGVAANLLAVPLGEAAALPLCLVHALLSPWPAAERGCALAASGALGLVRLVARAFTATRWLLLDVPPPSSWELAIACIALSALLLPRGRKVVLAGSALALLVVEVGLVRAGAPHGVLRATFLDVGQGDSALVDLPDGEAIVIDGGGLVGSPIDTGLRVLAPALRERRRSRIAVAALSHPHPDHFTGLPTGLASLHVGAAWDTGQGERDGVGGAYASWLAGLRRARVPVLGPGVLCGARELGGARVEVLAPCPGPSPDRGANDNSFVVRISYGSRAFLFVGDAEREEEASLLSAGLAPRLRADVLKVGHHGSRTSTSPAFLAAVHPAAAVISTGVRNRFGHPSPATLATLAAAGVPVWRTDRNGQVVATTDGTSLTVTSIDGRSARFYAGGQ
jgi:competence protein ComEC